MSHFTVLVIGENPEQQLQPFNEQPEIGSPYLFFNDKTDEYKEEYLEKTVKDFYCSSSSSWGAEITDELFKKLKKANVGLEMDYAIERKSGFNYFKRGGKYRAYQRRNNKPVFKNFVWFEVIGIKQTTHPDPDVCFEGIIRVKKIDSPTERKMTDVYPTFEDFIENYIETKPNENNRYGYFHNPNAKWDWYSLGGRRSGMIKLKDGATGKIGESGVFKNSVGIDSAVKSDIANIDEIKTFAVLKDGKWFERGEMGWFGCVSDEKPQEQWDDELQKLIHELPDNELLSIYDCHI